MKQILIILTLFLLSSCANMVPLSGGQKDEKIPTLKSSNLSATNFNQDHIKLEFDEYVELENGQKTITIQPKHTTFTISSTAKSIKIKFDSALRKNTTYVLNIAGGIKDLNEGNKYSLSYIFSTGPELDTGYISYKIKNFEDYRQLKIGLNIQSVDSVSKLKFDYNYELNDAVVSIKGLGKDIRYNCWVYTDLNNDNVPDEYSPIYYDTIALDSTKEITLNQWIDSRNIKTANYKTFTKIFKRLNDESTYNSENAIYIDKDSSLFYQINADTLPILDLNKELSNKIKASIRCIKSNKEFLVIVNKCGIRQLTLTDNINYKEDENYFYINSKIRIDSINLKIKYGQDSISVFSNKLEYEESNKISTLKITKSNKIQKIIMEVYQNEKLISIKKLNLKNDLQFYMNPGIYKIIFYATDSFKNISFDLNKMQRINCAIIKKEIILKPNWDEVLQLIF